MLSIPLELIILILAEIVHVFETDDESPQGFSIDAQNDGSPIAQIVWSHQVPV